MSTCIILFNWKHFIMPNLNICVCVYIYIGLHLRFSQLLIKQSNEVLWQTTAKKLRSRLQAGENHKDMKFHRARLNRATLSFSSEPLLAPKSLLQPSAGLAPASLSLPGMEKPRARHSTAHIYSILYLWAYILPHMVAHNLFFHLSALELLLRTRCIKYYQRINSWGREKRN